MIHSARLLSFAAFLALPLTAVMLLGGGDRREEIRLPDDTHAAFRAEMKSHMISLRDLTRAMATGDYREAARVAEDRVEFGHFMWTAMEEDGLSEARIARLRTEVEERSDREVLGSEDTGSRGTLAVPMEFRTLGRNLKTAALRFTLLAQKVDSPADPRTSTALNHAYQDLVAACQACHELYRIPRDER
ncbi:MAG: hypothetical protein K9H25_04940 [Rhodospirillum sp.]|nr:hypothetical protein [Rhodospirillum sp.]MCF8490482.1 hypothetical protein [Rhodospirillum sp.]MCF8500088.1 hypothetical protein [Rhodospirillum sp.]